MPLNQQDHILIEKKIMDQLNDEDHKIFEERLNDPDFKNEFNLQSDLLIAFKAEGREHLKSQLKGFEKKIEKNANSKKKDTLSFSIGRVLMIAASFALLIFAGNWFLNQSSSNDQLYAQYFNDYPNVVAPINKGATKTDKKEKAFQTYELKKYQDALDQFDQLSIKDDGVKLYQGLCEMALEHPERAIEYFDSIDKTDSPFYVPMNWYKALALLKIDNVNDSKVYLNFVVNNAETKTLKDQAIKLLETLNR